MSLPPNEMRCGNCGFSNVPGPGGNIPGGSSPQMPMSGPPSQSGFNLRQQFGSGTWGSQPGPQMGRPANAPTASGLFTPPSIPQPITSGPVPVTPGPVPVMPGPIPVTPGPVPQADMDGWAFPESARVPAANRPAPTFTPAPMMRRMTSGLNRPVSKVRVAMGVIVLVILIISGSIIGIAYFNKETKPTQQKVVAVPTPNSAPQYLDPFNDNTYGWNLESEPGKYSAQIGGGNLTLEDDNHKLLWEQLPGQQSFSDFTLYVNATLTKGDPQNGYGVYIRGSANANSDLATYYRFELYGDGAYGIYKGIISDNGQTGYTKLVDYTPSTAVNKAGKVNHIRITAQGSSLSFMVNGYQLQTLNDTSYAKGTIAFFVSNTTDAKPGAQAQFSEFGIYKPGA